MKALPSRHRFITDKIICEYLRVKQGSLSNYTLEMRPQNEPCHANLTYTKRYLSFKEITSTASAIIAYPRTFLGSINTGQNKDYVFVI